MSEAFEDAINSTIVNKKPVNPSLNAVNLGVCTNFTFNIRKTTLSTQSASGNARVFSRISPYIFNLARRQ
jgi:hypothetical protein